MALFGLIPQGPAMGINPATIPGFNSEAPPIMPGQQQAGYTPQPIGIPGLLGIKGGFRDALGAIGDALLVGQGRDAMYAPAKERELMKQDMADFADDPLGAIAKVSARDPIAGRELRNQYLENKTEQEKATLENNKTQAELFEKAAGRAGALMFGANEATWAPMRERVLAMGKGLGIDFSPYLPEAYSEEAKNNIVNLGMKASELRDDERDLFYKSERLEDYDTAEARQQRNTDSMIARRGAQTAQGAARVAQGERRTAAYESRVANQNARPSRGSSTRSSSTRGGKDYQTVSASRIPASAKFGTKDGKRVAQYDGKIVYVGD